MQTLKKSLNTWNTPSFPTTLKTELAQLDITKLPLQQALTQSSHLSVTPISVNILKTTENENDITVKTGVFFFGAIAGCNCADDPTTVDEIQEYCEMLVTINKETAEVAFSLV